MAFLFYRWEVILRETAILGILGIATLGFYIDSAFETFRFDVALLLILVSAALNISVDQFARYLRQRLQSHRYYLLSRRHLFQDEYPGRNHQSSCVPGDTYQALQG